MEIQPLFSDRMVRRWAPVTRWLSSGKSPNPSRLAAASSLLLHPIPDLFCRSIRTMAKAMVASNFMIVAAAVVLLMCSTVHLVFSVVPPPYITTRGPGGKGGDGDPSSPSSSSSKYRIYIVFLRPPPEADTMDDEALQSWYQSSLTRPFSMASPPVSPRPSSTSCPRSRDSAARCWAIVCTTLKWCSRCFLELVVI